ncbi:A-type flavoprotein 2 [Spironucleus salmonicida]|uniref:A-type flavoprotein 2 n=2 Tax=Spironucleus TaxID=39709 RepID=K7REL8_9EUKA|nr:A-type flavoprotein 2 [Spironucleus salmonicida]KAH0570903.1 A-type flavoprotein 2 [Spironucleus salmonicida]|eukprot:EST48966.1 A-type flavoprotein 2 [Spironucleus salmonicida]
MAFLPNPQPMLDDIHWVGIVDWAVRIFHGYHTDEGSSYNSYLIMDEQPTLIDSVKYPFVQEHLERIQAVCALDKIKFIIMNHAEGDHTSSLPLFINQCVNATIVTNKICMNHLQILYPSLKNFDRWQIVDAKSTLNIGKRTLKFVPVPLLHWPDSMFTYSEFDQTLFSNDGFGQHLASAERWSDELPQGQIERLMDEYTANILGHVPHLIKKAVEAASTLSIKNILVAHGASYRGDAVGWAVKKYFDFGAQTHFKPKVSIVYDTMYGTTARAALAIAEGVKSAGAVPHMLPLSAADITKAALNFYDSPCVALGSPTLNSTYMPAQAAVINYCGGLKLLNTRETFLFGAYGWAEKATKDMKADVEKVGAVNSIPAVTWKYNVDVDVLNKCKEAGFQLGKKALVRCGK